MKNDTYTIKKHYVEVQSASGRKYAIMPHMCSCTGYGFRRKCRHMDYAKSHNLFKDVVVSDHVLRSFKNSKHIKDARKKALKSWLHKNGYDVDDNIMTKVERFVTIETTPNQLIEKVRELIK